MVHSIYIAKESSDENGIILKFCNIVTDFIYLISLKFIDIDDTTTATNELI